MPPVRCGRRAANSPMHRQTIRPMMTTRAIAGMAAAPMEETANGTMPVTRMVPASPITNAPHQFVPRLREVATSAGGPLTAVPCSLMCSSPQGARVWSVGVGGSWDRVSEGLQVALELPRGDLGVRRPDLGPLGGDEVVGVVPFGGLAQALAQRLVSLQVLERVPERHGHGPQPEFCRLGLAHLEEVELAGVS